MLPALLVVLRVEGGPEGASAGLREVGQRHWNGELGGARGG